jgi:hypothetical protein
VTAERTIGLSVLVLVILATSGLADESNLTWPGPSVVTPATEPLSEGCMLPGECESCSTPHLQFTADLLILGREGPDSGGLFFNSETGEELLNLDQMAPSGEAGVRLGLIFFDEGGYDLELSYLGTDRFVADRTRSSDDGIVFPFFGGIPAEFSNSYQASYSSRLRSGEINVRRRLQDRVALLAGFRVVELKERFDIRDDDGGFFSSTDNDLYGLQGGADLILWTIRRSQLFSTLKAGVYYNNADVMAEAANRGRPIQFIAGEDEVAFVGDVALGLLIPMGPRADLRMGYQGIFLDGVGLAPNQSRNYDLFTGSGSLVESTLFYHGGFLGVDVFF